MKELGDTHRLSTGRRLHAGGDVLDVPLAKRRGVRTLREAATGALPHAKAAAHPTPMQPPPPTPLAAPSAAPPPSSTSSSAAAAAAAAAATSGRGPSPSVVDFGPSVSFPRPVPSQVRAAHAHAHALTLTLSKAPRPCPPVARIDLTEQIDLTDAMEEDDLPPPPPTTTTTTHAPDPSRPHTSPARTHKTPAAPHNPSPPPPAPPAAAAAAAAPTEPAAGVTQPASSQRATPAASAAAADKSPEQAFPPARRHKPSVPDAPHTQRSSGDGEPVLQGVSLAAASILPPAGGSARPGGRLGTVGGPGLSGLSSAPAPPAPAPAASLRAPPPHPWSDPTPKPQHQRSTAPAAAAAAAAAAQSGAASLDPPQQHTPPVHPSQPVPVPAPARQQLQQPQLQQRQQQRMPPHDAGTAAAHAHEPVSHPTTPPATTQPQQADEVPAEQRSAVPEDALPQGDSHGDPMTACEEAAAGASAECKAREDAEEGQKAAAPVRRRFKPTPTVRRGAAPPTSDTPGPADAVPPASDGGPASAPLPESATHPPPASAGEGGGGSSSSSAGAHAATARVRDFATRMEQEEWEKREKVISAQRQEVAAQREAAKGARQTTHLLDQLAQMQTLKRSRRDAGPAAAVTRQPGAHAGGLEVPITETWQEASARKTAARQAETDQRAQAALDSYTAQQVKPRGVHRVGVAHFWVGVRQCPHGVAGTEGDRGRAVAIPNRDPPASVVHGQLLSRVKFLGRGGWAAAAPPAGAASPRTQTTDRPIGQNLSQQSPAAASQHPGPPLQGASHHRGDRNLPRLLPGYPPWLLPPWLLPVPPRGLTPGPEPPASCHVSVVPPCPGSIRGAQAVSDDELEPFTPRLAAALATTVVPMHAVLVLELERDAMLAWNRSPARPSFRRRARPPTPPDGGQLSTPRRQTGTASASHPLRGASSAANALAAAKEETRTRVRKTLEATHRVSLRELDLRRFLGDLKVPAPVMQTAMSVYGTPAGDHAPALSAESGSCQGRQTHTSGGCSDDETGGWEEGHVKVQKGSSRAHCDGCSSVSLPLCAARGSVAAASENLRRWLKTAKIRFHPDKVPAGSSLFLIVMSEEVSKILNAWDMRRV
ncbi:MAG: hypothetical protein WDW38_003922 [Sanguina aurantia]